MRPKPSQEKIEIAAKNANLVPMLTTLYQNLLRALSPAIDAYLHRRVAHGKEDPSRLEERKGVASRARPSGRLIWCHAASVGEAQSLLSLIKRLRSDYLDASILVTTGTVTSAKLMAERLPEGAFHQYIPLDNPNWVKNFLDHWKPDLVLWVESDFWPALLAEVKRRDIPAVLLNARMSEKSFRRWKLARGLIADVLSAFGLCLAQNAKEAERLTTLGAKNVCISRNLKYAATPLPWGMQALEEVKDLIGTRPHFLFAATHPGEGEIACQVHRNLRAQKPDLLTIILPRHPVRGQEIAKLAVSLGLKPALRSKREGIDSITDIYIADTLGETGLFYRLSPWCIMGGSFVPVGGHNPIEPAQFGCRIIHGPHMFNFVTICEDFHRQEAMLGVTGAEELQTELSLALANPEHRERMGKAAQSWVQDQAHVVDEIMQALSTYLKPEVAA